MHGLTEVLEAVRQNRIGPGDTPESQAEKDARRRPLLERLLGLREGADLGPEEAYQVAWALSIEQGTRCMERAVSLAFWAWQNGNSSAAILYAQATDRLCNFERRPQKFGTIRWHLDGGEELAPIDGSVTDEQRAQVGLPPLAEIRRSIEEGNRQRAREAFEAGALPEGVEFRRVWRDVTPAEIRERWQQEQRPVWSDGHSLTLVCQGEAEEMWVLGGIQMPMWRLPDTDLWVVMVRIKELGGAVISYGFFPYAGGQPAPVVGTPPAFKEWRGPEAPAPLPRAVQLAGTIEHAVIASAHLGEERGVSVYVPPGYAGGPVVFMADGQSLESFARVLEPFILARQIPPVLLVGIHHGSVAAGSDRRSEEYLPGFHPQRFEAHAWFVTEEVIPWVELTWGASPPSQRAVFGYSNGAAFAVTMGSRRPDLFGNVLAFSLSWPAQPAAWAPGSEPRHFLVAGTLESGFRKGTARWADYLSRLGAEYVHRERVCGHDQAMWEEEFPGAVWWAFAFGQG